MIEIRHRLMRRLIVALIAFALVAVSCGGAETVATTSSPSPATEPPDDSQLMALALERLVGEDNSFGPGHRFSVLLVQSRLDQAAGNATTVGSGRPLSDAERGAIERALADLGRVQWIDDPAEWRTEDLRPTIDGAAIVGVGAITFDDAGALVPVSLWCGGVCGIWITYRLQVVDGEWAVIGSEGPMIIS